MPAGMIFCGVSEHLFDDWDWIDLGEEDGRAEQAGFREVTNWARCRVLDV